MGRKRKKRTKHPLQQGQEKPKKKSNLKVVSMMECRRDNSTVSSEECQACTFHKDGCCDYEKPKEVIKTLNFASPMRYNRNFFQMSSESLREASLNYYIATDIMNEVRSIKGYPNYRKLKMELLSGEFKTDEEAVKAPEVLNAEVIKPLFFFIRGKGTFAAIIESCTDPEREAKLLNPSSEHFDLLVDGAVYYKTEWDGTISGDWTVLFYLYRMYELNGFGDYEIEGQPYRVLFNESEGKKADLIVLQKEDRIIIGRKVKK